MANTIYERAMTRLYFGLVWPASQWVRDTIRLSTVIALAVSTLTVVPGLFLKALDFNIVEASQTAAALNVTIFAGFVVCSFLTWLNSRLSRRDTAKANALFSSLWRALHYQRRYGAGLDAVPFLLGDVVFGSFQHIGAHRVWFWERDGEKLVVRPQRIHPPTPSTIYVRELPMGEGVAGKVAIDLRPRYVPRLKFPFSKGPLRQMSASLLHSVVYAIRNEDEIEQLAIGAAAIEKSSIIVNSRAPNELISFLAVPALPIGDNSCAGVLCIDFSRPNPLTSDDIKMVMVFAALLAEAARTKVP